MAVNPFEMSFADDDDNSGASMFTQEELNDDVSQSSSPVNETKPSGDKKTGSESNMSNAPKYNITDFYWLVHPNVLESNKTPIPSEECGMLVIGYNASFSNLRLTFYDLPDSGSALKPGEIHKNEMKTIATVNVFSETAMQILAMITSKKSGSVMNYERIFSISSNTDWQPTLAKFDIDLAKGVISIIIKVGEKGKKVYHLKEWQITAFMDSLKFMTNNRSWMASLATPK